jgi:DNA-binding response OmpR family regulator
MHHRVLVVEDDPDIGSLLQLHITECASEVRLESNGTRALLLAQAAHWDLIVLDWLLPGVDGVSICRRLRANRHRQPIMLLTSRTGESDRVAGLDAGADDYVAKPFGMNEFKARVRAQLRRSDQLRQASATATALPPAQAGRIRIDTEARVTSIAGTNIALTAREFDLLAHFMRHPGRVFTREQLLDAVWGSGFDGYAYTVNSHINRLRAKIEADAAKPQHIITVWGVGYRFDQAQAA